MRLPFIDLYNLLQELFTLASLLYEFENTVEIERQQSGQELWHSYAHSLLSLFLVCQ